MANITHPSVMHLLAPTQHGGLEQTVTMLAAAQNAKGVHVAAVVTPGRTKDHPFLARLETLGVPYTPVVVSGRGYLREYKLLTRLAERVEPEILQTHGYRADLIGGMVGRALRIPVVSTVHGFTGARLRIRINERLQFRLLKKSDAIIAVSRPLVERLVNAGLRRDRIHYVPNGFWPIVQPLRRSDARNRLGIGGGERVVAWVGRLSPEKGADVMLEALARTPTSWRLAIVGDGPERKSLHQLAQRIGVSHRVSWHGWIPEAGSLLSAFDTFVLSSRTEGTPITLLEAMRTEVPIVATQVGGVPDVVTSAEAILVPSENPQAIASALARIDEDPRGA
jgi:glycosyltransferase involved in cell wall biosynthesis